MSRPGRRAGASVASYDKLVAVLGRAMEARKIELDGLMAAGTFSGMVGISHGGNIVDNKWL